MVIRRGQCTNLSMAELRRTCMYEAGESDNSGATFLVQKSLGFSVKLLTQGCIALNRCIRNQLIEGLVLPSGIVI